MVRMGPLGSRVLPPSRPWCSTARPLHHPADSSIQSHWTRLDPTRPRPIPHLSGPDPSGADQIDADHQPPDLAMRPWQCRLMPRLAVAFLVGHWVAVYGAGAGCPAGRCHCVRTTLPPSRVSAAPGTAGYRCPPAASAVHASGPSMSAGCADLARNPSRCPRSRTLRPCPRCGWECGRVLAGWPQATADTAAAPEQAGTRRPPVANHPCTPAGRGSGHRPPPAGTARVSDVVAALRPPGDAVRTAAELDAASVRCPPLLLEPRRCPDGRCPPGTLPQTAAIRCYGKRSPARRPLAWCRHRWYARAS
jgi:hypothetical protein